MIRSTAPDQWLIDTQSISGDCFTYHFRRDQKDDVSWRIVAQYRAGLLIKSEADTLLLAVYDVTTARPMPCPTLKDRLLSAFRAVSAVVSREWTLLVAAWMYASVNAERKLSQERKCWTECSGTGTKGGKS
jgi:hypothetical protein